MVHQIETQEQAKSYLTFVAPELFVEFEVTVLNAYYRYSKYTNFFLMPKTLYEDENFLESFDGPEHILMESHMIEELEKPMKKITEDEAEEFRSNYEYGCWYRNQDLFYDIEAVLDRHQLFYVNQSIEYNYLKKESEEFHSYENSPLQEVW